MTTLIGSEVKLVYIVEREQMAGNTNALLIAGLCARSKASRHYLVADSIRLC
jgi:hypothetical protein